MTIMHYLRGKEHKKHFEIPDFKIFDLGDVYKYLNNYKRKLLTDKGIGGYY